MRVEVLRPKAPTRNRVPEVVARLALAGTLALCLLMACGCSPQEPAPGISAAASAQGQPDLSLPAATSSEPATLSAGAHAASLHLTIDGLPVAATWEDNASVTALKRRAALMPFEVRMSPHGGFEQFGPLGFDLPRDDAQTTAGPGDIVLYEGNQVVVFYGSNSWAYTRLGKITGMTADELTGLLGGDAVTLAISASS